MELRDLDFVGNRQSLPSHQEVEWDRK